MGGHFLKQQLMSWLNIMRKWQRNQSDKMDRQ